MGPPSWARSTTTTPSSPPSRPSPTTTEVALKRPDRAVSARLPPAVQGTIAGLRARAAASGLDVVDLSLGAPVDPTPEVVQRALARSGDAPGYPVTVGRPDLREAYVGWLARRHSVSGLAATAALPVIGTKELIGSLALHLGWSPGDGPVALPRLAYPTYAVGAALVGAATVLVDDVDDLEALAADERPWLVWVNSPSNPTGRVLDVDELRAVVAWCRAHDALLVSDECYLDLGWEVEPVSVLHPDVCGDSHEGVLAVHSLSKRSNLAGYRCGFVAGDPGVVAELADVRRNLGLQMPGPQQATAIAALDDEQHVVEQRARYAERRALLRPALEVAGFTVEHSGAGLYLWATAGESSEASVGRLADVGIMAVAGSQYGAAGARHVRVALTASDTDVALAVQRLAHLAPLDPAPTDPAPTDPAPTDPAIPTAQEGPR